MKRDTNMYGARGQKYGIWNSVSKEWQFGICEDTPMLAQARLFQHIGDDARKWRFQARVLPEELRKDESGQDPALVIEVQRKDRELKAMAARIRELEAGKKHVMEQRTVNIIMCCKGHCCLEGGKDADRLTAIAAYMSHECGCPQEDYKGELLEQIMQTALFDYMSAADNPGSDLRRLFERPGLGPEPSMSERIASVFALCTIKGQDPDKPHGTMKYVNGFSSKLVQTSRIQLGERTKKPFKDGVMTEGAGDGE